MRGHEDTRTRGHGIHTHGYPHTQLGAGSAPAGTAHRLRDSRAAASGSRAAAGARHSPVLPCYRGAAAAPAPPDSCSTCASTHACRARAPPGRGCGPPRVPGAQRAARASRRRWPATGSAALKHTRSESSWWQWEPQWGAAVWVCTGGLNTQHVSFESGRDHANHPRS